MKNKEFYKPITSLVNLILTGEKEICKDGDSITVTQEFIKSLQPYNNDDYNLYFLSCIEEFLNSCSKQEKVDVIKVLFENEDIIHGVSLINGPVMNSKSSKQDDFSNTVDSVLSNFLTDGEVHPILTLSLYFYVESIAKSTIINGEITKNDYEKIIEFHSIKRDLKHLFSF